VHVFSDNGVSGAKGRKNRPGLDALLKGVARRARRPSKRQKRSVVQGDQKLPRFSLGASC
jgi:hypothetical protein